MIIRPATAEDVPAVLPMVAATYALHIGWDSAKFGVVPDIVQRYGSWLTDRAVDDRSVFLVAAADESGKSPPELAGFLIATVERELPIYLLKEFGFIHDLWVEPAYRHEGIARQMTMLAIEKFAKMGVKQVRLDTAAANDAARALFARCGFRESIREMLIELRQKSVDQRDAAK
jgi:ribosomal protein S18 acetylase RimI-like enzyme